MVVFTRSSTRSGEPPRPQPVRPPNEPNTSTEASVREVGPHALPSDIGIETKEVEPATKKRKRNTPTPKPKPRKKKPKTTQDSHARNTTGDDDARVGVETEEVGPPTNRRKREPITASPEARKKPKTIQDAPAQDTIGHDDTRRRTQEDSKKGRKPGPKRQSPIRVIRVEECRDGRSNERVQPLDIIADGAKEATTTPLGTNKTLSLSHQLQGDWNIEHSDVDIPSEHSSGTDDDHGERLTDAPTPGRELDIHAEKEDAFPELLSPPRRSWFLDDDDKVMSCYRRTPRVSMRFTCFNAARLAHHQSLGCQEFEPLACGEVSWLLSKVPFHMVR